MSLKNIKVVKIEFYHTISIQIDSYALSLAWIWRNRPSYSKDAWQELNVHRPISTVAWIARKSLFGSNRLFELNDKGFCAG